MKDKINRFILLGLALAFSNQTIPQYRYSILKNIRQYQTGIIQPRKGLGAINASATANTDIHSIARLNDETPTASQAYGMFIGAGGVVYSDNAAHNAFTSRSTGYSGNPLSMLPFRPNNSPAPYLYVADTNKMEKFTVAGAVAKWGITPPNSAPQATFAPLTLNNIINFDSTAGLTAGGTAGALSAPNRVNTTISHILYDTGNTGWATVVPAAFTSDIQPFCRIFTNAGDKAVVDSVYKAIPSTTIAAIAYDSGSTGLCTIILTATPKEGLVPNALIRIATAENCRILSVTEGKDGTICFRTSTTATRSAGDTVDGLNAFRIYYTANHAAAETLTDVCVQSTITAGTGTVDRTATFNLAVLSNRPTTSKDYLHISIKISDLSLFTEGRLILDCDSVTNDFTRNYFYVPFRANDFVPAVVGTTTQLAGKARKIQRKIIDITNTITNLRSKQAALRAAGGDLPTRKAQRLVNALETQAALQRQLDILNNSPAQPISQGSSGETVTGGSQWTEFRFRLSDFQRVGSDTSRGIADIKAIRLQFLVTGSVDVQLDELYFAGSYGAEVGEQGEPLLFRYRYRNSATGARSYWSPPMRNGILPHRQQVTLTPSYSGDAQVDKIDWIVLGGNQDQWKLFGTQPNSGTFTYEFDDTALEGFPTVTFNEFVPFPVADTHKTTLVNVVGTSIVKVSGDNFNVKWAEGTEVIINNKVYTLYGSPTSTTKLELNECAGNWASVSMDIFEPILTDTSLPCVWGTYGLGSRGTVMFAVGDSINAGTLYWTNLDDPDSASDFNFLEITSPSEPLMNGFLFNSRAYVFSTENLYAIYPSPAGGNEFFSQPTPCTIGLFGKYSLAVGESGVFFLGKDGIYVTQGGEAISITDEALYPLFPHDGIAGTTTNGAVPPDMSSPNSHFLSVGGGKLRYEYLGTDAAWHSIIFRIDGLMNKAYVESIDDYSPTIHRSYFDTGKVHRWLLGGNDGRLYIYGGANGTATGDGSTGTTAISCQVRTWFDDLESPRSHKFFSDMYANINPDQANVTLQPLFDDGTVTPASTAASGAAQGISIIELNIGSGQYAKNVGLDISWSSSTRTPKLYDYGFLYDDKPSDTVKGATDADNLGVEMLKFIQGFYLRANTFGNAKQFKVQADNGVNGAWADVQTFTVNFAQEATQEFSFTTPVTAHNLRIIGTDGVVWQLIDVKYVFEPEPPEVTEYITQPTSHDLLNYHHLRDAELMILSTAQINLTVTIDNVNYTYAIASTGGVKSKVYLPFKAIKGKVHTYSFVSNDASKKFRLYERDSVVRVHDWKSVQGQGYLLARPFGAPSRINGALI